MGYQRVLKKSFRQIMARTPVWMRSVLTKRKIARMTAHLMSKEDLLQGEQDPQEREKLVEKYMRKYPEQTGQLQRKIQSIIENNSVLEITADVKMDIAFCWFAYGFYPDEYVFFGLGGKNSTPEKRRKYVSERERICFRYSVNDFSESLFSDKADVYRRLKAFYKRDALCVKRTSDFRSYSQFITVHPIYVEKIVNSSRGDGVRLVDTGIESFNPKTEFKKLVSYGKVLLEEKIEQGDELSVFNKGSVNTVRIATFRTRHGVIAPYGFFRTGREGSFIDNAAKGGIFCIIDTTNGICKTIGYDEAGERYEVHPDSQQRFLGFRLPDWAHAIELCTDAAAHAPSNVKYLSWDLAYSNKGWCVVEVNPSGQFLWQVDGGCREKMRNLVKDMDQLVSYQLDRF